MDPREMALFLRVFHLPAEITITSVHPSPTELVVGVACQAPRMECPECHQPSARIHGSYQRTVADLPCAGRNVILALTVRKFVCGTPTCPRKIFTERLPGLVESYAWMTSRLIALIQALGLVAGGQMGRIVRQYVLTLSAATQTIAEADGKGKRGRRPSMKAPFE